MTDFRALWDALQQRAYAELDERAYYNFLQDVLDDADKRMSAIDEAEDDYDAELDEDDD